MNISLKKILFLVPSITASAAIVFVSHRPNVELPELGIDFTDKLLHSAAYFVYCIAVQCGVLALFSEKPRRFLRLVSGVFATIFAVSDEIHQSFIPGRSADPADFIADFFGIIAALFLLPLIIKIYERL